MLGFMVKETHAADGPKRTAADGDAQKSFFRDTPLMGFGFLFVNAKADKGKNIYKYKVHEKVFQNQIGHSFVFWVTAG